MSQLSYLPEDYADWLGSLKQRIRAARQRALLAANAEQIQLYHEIGRDILERQSRQSWGAKVIDRLASDLKSAFPEMKGLSSSNLKYMRFFAQECPERLIGQQSADQLPWFHVVTLITKLRDPGQREWYARAALAQSWPRDTLVVQIKSQLHLRQGAAVSNFPQRLGETQGGLAQQILKDPYHFDFLGLGLHNLTTDLVATEIEPANPQQRRQRRRAAAPLSPIVPPVSSRKRNPALFSLATSLCAA